MEEFSVLVEGLETDGKGYFINFKGIAVSENNARVITLKKAQEMGLTNVTIDEIERGGVVTSKDEGVLKVSGKSYYTI